MKVYYVKSFPSCSDSKESTCNAGDLGSICGWGKSPRVGNGNSLQHSCLENSMDRGAWWTTVHSVTKSQTWLGSWTTTTYDLYPNRGGLVAQSCPTLCNPVDCSLPGSSVHGVSQARILELVVIFFSRASSQTRDWTWVSCIVGRFFTNWDIREAPVS